MKSSLRRSGGSVLMLILARHGHTITVATTTNILERNIRLV